MIDVPMLVLHAREDEIASVASVERVLDRASAFTRLVVLQNIYHIDHHRHDRRRVADQLADFVVASHSKPRPARFDTCLSDLWMPT